MSQKKKSIIPLFVRAFLKHAIGRGHRELRVSTVCSEKRMNIPVPTGAVIERFTYEMGWTQTGDKNPGEKVWLRPMGYSAIDTLSLRGVLRPKMVVKRTPPTLPVQILGVLFRAGKKRRRLPVLVRNIGAEQSRVSGELESLRSMGLVFSEGSMWGLVWDRPPHPKLMQQEKKEGEAEAKPPKKSGEKKPTKKSPMRRVWMYLERNREGRNLSEIAGRLQMKRSQVQNLLSRMEADGLVRMEKSKTRSGKIRTEFFSRQDKQAPDTFSDEVDPQKASIPRRLTDEEKVMLSLRKAMNSVTSDDEPDNEPGRNLSELCAVLGKGRRETEMLLRRMVGDGQIYRINTSSGGPLGDEGRIVPEWSCQKPTEPKKRSARNETPLAGYISKIANVLDSPKTLCEVQSKIRSIKRGEVLGLLRSRPDMFECLCGLGEVWALKTAKRKRVTSAQKRRADYVRESVELLYEQPLNKLKLAAALKEVFTLHPEEIGRWVGGLLMAKKWVTWKSLEGPMMLDLQAIPRHYHPAELQTPPEEAKAEPVTPTKSAPAHLPGITVQSVHKHSLVTYDLVDEEDWIASGRNPFHDLVPMPSASDTEERGGTQSKALDEVA